jgi:hypothetical protein
MGATSAPIFFAAVNQSLRLCGGDVTRTSNCRIRRQAAPHFESDARIYDVRATFRMILAHGTYVAPSLLHAAEQAYLYQQEKTGNACGVVEPNQGR